jgi:hypothetical protein
MQRGAGLSLTASEEGAGSTKMGHKYCAILWREKGNLALHFVVAVSYFLLSLISQ